MPNSGTLFIIHWKYRILFTVGNVDIVGDIAVDIEVDTRSIVGRHSVDSRSTLGRQLVDTRSTLGRYSVDTQSTLGRYRGR